MNFPESVIKWLYPPVCAACSQVLPVDETRYLCEKCKDAFIPIEYKTENCEYFIQGDFKAMFGYNQAMKNAIYSFKYDKNLSQGRALSQAFSEEFLKHPPDFSKYFCIIPVPIHRNRLLERGFNQAEILAMDFSKKSGVKINTNLVKRVVDTAPQSSVPSNIRRQNVKNCFALNKNFDFTNKNFIVLDDILTTGSTLASIAGILENSGANSVLCVSLSLSDNKNFN